MFCRFKYCFYLSGIVSYVTMSNNTIIMIKVNNLSFHYQKKYPLFQELNLELEGGSIVGLLGKNGVGKTTLLKLISGLVSPKQGGIVVNGYIPFERKPDFLADIYMVPEEFAFQNITIGQYVKVFSTFYPRFDHQKLQRVLNEFQLQLSDQLNKISHGQRKKFLIAFALASNCQLLLFDEPTNGLDIPSKSQFRKILVSSVSDEQLVVISTHQVKDIDSVIDTVIVMNEGTIVYHQRMNDIIQELCFEIVPSLGEEENGIYYEKCPSGYKLIRPSSGEGDTVVDLELLFNAIVNNQLNNRKPL